MENMYISIGDIEKTVKNMSFVEHSAIEQYSKFGYFCKTLLAVDCNH